MAKLRVISNPPNPYTRLTSEWLEEPPPRSEITVFEEESSSILSENDSPDLPFRWSCNPYRGCQHACAYCYARRTHEYFGWGAGTDFDTKIVVKVNAPELLDQKLSSPRWSGEYISFSGVTDCYQPLEAAWRLTRRCLEVCLKHENAVSVITKNFLVARDVDLLKQLNSTAGCKVFVSVPFSEASMASVVEPQASTPERRWAAMRVLSDAGIPVGVMVAPIILGLNDHQIPEILEKSHEHGARFAGCMPLRLPGSVAPVFLERMREAFPLRAGKIENHLRAIRNGRLNNPEFGSRFEGSGPYWDAALQLFETWRCRLEFQDPSELPLGVVGRKRNAVPTADPQRSFDF